MVQNKKTTRSANIGILGAGIMGCCLALELAQRGRRVDLIDLAATPMTGASLHNEGKLHLGFVYAKDPFKATHRVMMRGSLSFARILEKLTGCGAEDLKPSRPFQYFVPIDSQLDLASITRHFQEVEEAVHEEVRASGNLYLGRRVDRYYERNAPDFHSRLFSPGLTLGSFNTEEVSISTVAVADILIRAIKKETGINFIGNTEVLSAVPLDCGDVEVELRRNGEVLSGRYSCVANCLWEDKPRIDRTAGIPDHGQWFMRYKAMVNISAPAAFQSNIPSATGILGSYGDVVNHNNGTYYISWYPLCRLIQSTDGEGRQLHDRIHKWVLPRSLRKMKGKFPAFTGFVSSLTHKKFILENISEMAAYVPSVAGLLDHRKSCRLGGGVILARGITDIDDPDSYLHQRSAIGPAAYGPFVTIDTGKYCTAPLFAMEAADMITGII